MKRDTGLVIYLAKRLLQTERDQPYLFDDRLNDLDVAMSEYERAHGRIVTDIPEVDPPRDFGQQMAARS